MKRDKAIKTIKELPGKFDLEELMEKLVFVEKRQAHRNYPQPINFCNCLKGIPGVT